MGTMLAPDGVLLYLDEIQYFNKKQQQSLLEFMENGKITLIASTTENPYFYVYNAVLSRSTVFEFKAADGGGRPARHGPGHPASWGEAGGGHPVRGWRAGKHCRRQRRRRAQGHERGGAAAELRPCPGREHCRSPWPTPRMVAQRSAMRYDRDGDDHYDIASALTKSMRGSDPDAAPALPGPACWRRGI
ncbi:MAG: hypothetical protein ACLRWQ_07395 [Flavonifractor plautii]